MKFPLVFSSAGSHSCDFEEFTVLKVARMKFYIKYEESRFLRGICMIYLFTVFRRMVFFGLEPNHKLFS